MLKNLSITLFLILTLFSEATASLPEVVKPQTGDSVFGKQSAPVTIIEYSSLGCAACAEYHKYVFPIIKEEYINTGTVRYIRRDFPTTRSALAASMLVHCFQKDGQQNIIEILVQSHNLWAFNDNYQRVLKDIMAIGGISEEDFNRCMNDAKLQQEILSISLENAKRFDITRTPTIFVGGKKLANNYSIKGLAKTIKNEMQQLVANQSDKNVAP